MPQCVIIDKLGCLINWVLGWVGVVTEDGVLMTARVCLPARVDNISAYSSTLKLTRLVATSRGAHCCKPGLVRDPLNAAMRVKPHSVDLSDCYITFYRPGGLIGHKTG